jgi:hypothetical protein
MLAFESYTSIFQGGLIDNVALHHRPLGAVLAFSAEMGRRLGSSLGPDVFYQAPGQLMTEPDQLSSDRTSP